MNITLDMLRQSGLSIDWRSVYVAWRGFDTGIRYERFQIDTDEVVDLARERLGSGMDAEEEYAIFRLADAEPGRSEDIERFLSRLAERSGVTEARALRKWRFAHLKWLIRRIDDSPPQDEDQVLYDLEALYMFWIYYDALPDTSRAPSVSIGFELEERERALREHREWLREEEALLR